MGDAIRTIEKHTTAGEWALYMRSDECTWRFSDKPSGLTDGSLIFFCLHGLIQGVGEYAGTSKKPNSSGFYVVTTTNNMPLVDPTLKFKGYPQLRYLDLLSEQYDGVYAALVKKLRRYGQQYRNGTLDPDHRH